MHRCLCYRNLHELLGVWLLPITSFMTHLSFSSFSSSLFFTVFQCSGTFLIPKYYWKFLEYISSVSLSLSAAICLCLCLYLFCNTSLLKRKSWWIQRHCSAIKLTTCGADPCRDAPLIVGIRVFVSFGIIKKRVLQ